jgi:4-aminobutyrate aminotransferase / (S)-3-amino-2-methylpropionate transaminase / 5-aminovalerate transaminase
LETTRVINETNSTNAKLMARRQAAVSRGVGQAHQIFAARALNGEFWDVEGKRYVDFAGGIAVVNVGHCHPDVVGRVQKQTENYIHTCFQVIAYEPYVELCERLNALAPGHFDKKSALFTTGAEAVENAIKVARLSTNRSGIIAFTGAFHGRTMMTLGLTGKVAPYKSGFGPFPAEIHHALFPNAVHGISVAEALDSVETLLRNDIEASRVAAFIVEPVQGEGGFNVAPPEFISGLKTIADRHGILLIADEIQTGAGRTGTWFACEQWPVAPDLIVTAKSMAAGVPISAVIGRADLMDAPGPGGLGGTYAGTPLGCAAALAVLDVFDKEQLLSRSQHVGEILKSGLKTLAKTHTCIRDVRGLGAMVAIELFKDDKPAADLTRAVVAAAAQRGLILLACGTHGNVIRILVPLTVSDALLAEGLAILEASLTAAS